MNIGEIGLHQLRRDRVFVHLEKALRCLLALKIRDLSLIITEVKLEGKLRALLNLKQYRDLRSGSRIARATNPFPEATKR